MIPKSPKISAVFQKKHRGETIISLDGKIVGTGSDAIIALKKAKKKIPDIEKREFLIFRIHPKYLAA
ncbi:hypothetical protein COV82_04200 [Candidatus Peregrinibacteria bacterium CG11_big_fil_rev_8_21_14_0_20_46_8]|nr:MAG: hypothetical protein COV82_04200 [Candidatus Peregrinibacteria bacterium CG11_big_fil_rev_8_21_14_0_20_46_8]